MKPTLLISFLMVFFMVGPVNAEALMVTKNEVTAATIVEKPADELKTEKSSAPEENKEEVKGES
ncbi:MAG: hypothetical protein DRQ61_08705 [Gammaproteobacteria bacterium]|nr:MAG: hypothetical protein DRQ61_08705 [Gammaproteobacteria bacterium]